MIRIGPSIRPKFFGGGTDADAQAFITAAAITDATQQSAINTLVVDLKAYGIWTKMKAIYPFVGGTASTHKWNLKDPRDLDAAFRLVFAGGSTHSSTGWLPNGTNGYANSKFNVKNNLSINDAHISIYNRTNINPSSGILYGCSENTSTFLPIIQFYPNFSGNTLSDMPDFVSRISVSNSDRRGMYISNRTAINNFKLFKNNSLFGQNTFSHTQTTYPNENIYFGAFFSTPAPAPTNFISCEISFISLGNSLTDTEAANFYTAVQAYQTTLSRNV
jgi:hypothetical protein